jgi:uncharacterized protein YbjT (DUF2867 family)
VILVAGATGMLGGAIVRNLIARGESVRALVRSPSAEEAMLHAGAEPVRGDMKDPESLENACRDVRTVITTANSMARGGEDNIDTVDLKGNLSLIDAAARAGTGHFIFVAAQGAHPENPEPFLKAKGVAAQAIRDSGMAYTILFPDLYMDVWVPLVVLAPVAAGRPVIVVAGGSRKHYPVAVDDVAGFAAGAVGNDAALDKDLLIGGPDPLSWSDVIAAFERVHGTTLEVENLPLGAPMPGFPPAGAGLMSVLETYDSPQPLSAEEAKETFGVQLTGIEDFLRRSASRETERI